MSLQRIVRWLNTLHSSLQSLNSKKSRVAYLRQIRAASEMDIITVGRVIKQRFNRQTNCRKKYLDEWSLYKS